MSNDKISYDAKPITESFLIDGVEVEMDYKNKQNACIKIGDKYGCFYEKEIEREIKEHELFIQALKFAQAKLNERNQS